MNKLNLLILALCLATISKAQEFQFKLHFEDAAGNKDSVTIGYDQDGTTMIDTAFGEENILGTPLDSVFDVRISDELNANGNPSFQTKKQIVPDSCGGWFFPIVTIEIECKNWPVTASWDNTLFATTCTKGSVFTSIHPGGWWDTGSPSDLFRAELSSEKTVTFSSNYDAADGYNSNYAYVNASNDTIPVFWMAFGNKELLQTGSSSIENNLIFYPNPVSDYFYFNFPENSIKNISITDTQGKSKIASYQYGRIDFTKFEQGIYIVQISTTNGKIIKTKIVKE